MRPASRRLTALTTSLALHGAALIALLVVFRPFHTREAPVHVRSAHPVMVWIPDPRPAMRGGGGQPRTPTPVPPRPRTAALPSEPAPIVEPPTIEPAPEPQVVADATPSPSAAEAIDGAPRNDGGNGNGPGAGPGEQGGPGGGGDTPYGVGNNVTPPIPLRRPPPSYTADAMRVRLQGVVVLDCVVQPDGVCSDIRVTRSLDTRYGLDQQAIASAREWRFRPGLRAGEPVPVRVTLEIAFTIR